MTLARLTAKKLTVEDVKTLTDCVVSDFSGCEGLVTILLFGSAAAGTMTEASDIDVVLIFDTAERAQKLGRQAHGMRKLSRWPMDILCTDVETFRRKSEIGGVYFCAREDGRVLWGTMP